MGWGEKDGYDRHGRYHRVGTQNPKDVDCCIIGSLRRIGLHDNRLVRSMRSKIITRRRVQFFREQRNRLLASTS